MLGSKSFDVANPMVTIRIMCGLFYIPHILFKLNDLAGAMAFFGKAGFNPPLFFVSLALLAETICCAGLVLGLMTRYVAPMSIGVMACAVLAVLNTKGFGWLWNLGGVEYLVFWAIASGAVALNAWQQHWAAEHRSAAPPAATISARPV